MTIKSFNFADRGSYRCKCYEKSKNYEYSSSITLGKCFVLLFSDQKLQRNIQRKLPLFFKKSHEK